MTIESLIAILIAPFVGSFLGTIIDRLPEQRAVLVGRSACDGCGQPLSPLELIPIVSYFWQRGRCRTCGHELRAFYPAIELASVAIAASAVSVLSGWLLLISLYLGWSLLALAVIDLRHKILPDEINLPLIPAGLAVTYLHSPDKLAAHVIGMVLGFACLTAIAWVYRQIRQQDGLGLGDAKLLAAAGAWLGWATLPGLLSMAALFALAVALVRAAIGDRLTLKDEVAFGPYLAVFFWISWLFGPIMLL